VEDVSHCRLEGLAWRAALVVVLLLLLLR